MNEIAHGVRTWLLRLSRPSRELRPEQYSRLVDYHIHTKLCGHASGEPADYVREALRKGLSEIGFSDHMPLLWMRDEKLTMAPEDLPHYVRMIEDLRSSFNGLSIRLGIEVDYFPGRMDEVWEALSDYEFDYILGGVHYIDGWGFGDSRYLSSYEGKDPDEVFSRYFDIFCEAVEEGGFDIMAHPDLVKKHGIRPRRSLLGFYSAAADALARADVCVEINTSGLRKKTLEIYPSAGLLEACVGRGVSVTLGSDAHAPWQVGADFDVALGLLTRMGVGEICAFSSRRREVRSIRDRA